MCWVAEDLAKNLNFYSISSDGRVTLWTLSKSKLDYTDLMHLKLTGAEGAEVSAADDDALSGLAGGCCFDFSRLNDHLFLVGTEEGRIHKCSRAYQSQYLETYEGHYMAVYSVRWNNFNPRGPPLLLALLPAAHTPASSVPSQVRWNNFNPKLFLSCSADWTVKMWVHAHTNPRMTCPCHASPLACLTPHPPRYSPGGSTRGSTASCRSTSTTRWATSRGRPPRDPNT